MEADPSVKQMPSTTADAVSRWDSGAGMQGEGKETGERSLFFGSVDLESLARESTAWTGREGGGCRRQPRLFFASAKIAQLTCPSPRESFRVFVVVICEAAGRVEEEKSTPTRPELVCASWRFISWWPILGRALPPSFHSFRLPGRSRLVPSPLLMFSISSLPKRGGARSRVSRCAALPPPR